MNPTIFLLAVGELLGRLGSLAWIRQLVLEKENFEFIQLYSP